MLSWVSHWRYNWDEDVVLDEPAKLVYVKFIGDPGLNTVRACLHITREERPAQALQLVHEYRLGGEQVTQAIDLQAPGAYEINCPETPENISIRLAVPSKKIGVTSQ